MSFLKHAVLFAAAVAVAAASATAQDAGAKVFPPTADQKAEIHKKLAELSARLAALGDKGADPALRADVAIYKKAVDYILRFPEEFFGPAYAAETIAALDAGILRALELEAGVPSWPRRTGHLVRGFVSRVDGSVQPYGLTIPASYDGSKPMRLDVWLHGTQLQLNEVRFLAQQSGPHQTSQIAADDYIQLEPFGRMNHSYRYYAETDVFEAIAAVRRHYNIDPERILIRGHSMGGQGAWRLGLQHPSFFAALEASAGYVETKEYAAARLPKEGLAPYQEAALHYYDAEDYALNAFNIPTVGYGGETDAQLRASIRIREALEREGFTFTKEGEWRWTAKDLRALFMIGPATGHSWHAESKAASEAFLRSALQETAGRTPNHVRFVTYTTRFNTAHWVTVEGLEQTYARADVDARRTADLRQYTVTTRNVSRVRFDVPAASFSIDGQTLKAGSANPVFEKVNGAWAVASGRPDGLRKTHGLQGPIEDAFMDGFLAVRGTGQPWNAAVHDYTSQRLDVFRGEFAKWMRGDIRVKDDRSVSTNDIASYNLVLFGDPGSNSVMAKVVGGLPIQWTKEGITVGGETFSSADHALVLIYPNPLNPQKYIVLNTGHTFTAHRVNAGSESTFFPRLGDYAVLTTGGATKTAGLFDERWRLSEDR